MRDVARGAELLITQDTKGHRPQWNLKPSFVGFGRNSEKMPGLRLTPAQPHACGVSENETCRAVIERLVAASFCADADRSVTRVDH